MWGQKKNLKSWSHLVFSKNEACEYYKKMLVFERKLEQKKTDIVLRPKENSLVVQLKSNTLLTIFSKLWDSVKSLQSPFGADLAKPVPR